MFACVPFLERGKLLRDRGEQTDNDTDRCLLHVVAKFAYNFAVLLILSEINYEQSDELTGIR